jgi:hypothetical protein
VSTKRFSAWYEIGTKQVTCRVSGVPVEFPVKIVFFLSLAFVLAASVAVISKTSPPSSAHTEKSANYLY